MDWLPFISAFTIGLLGGAHCLGMCGGIIGALTMALENDAPRSRFQLVLIYNLGRILSYVLIALLFYSLIAVTADYFKLSWMRWIAGLLLIAMGLYLADWWRGLSYLEKIGNRIWQYIQPLSQSLLPVRSFRQALLLGLIWGWLPCGLIYSALAYSATASTAIQAGFIMLCFGLGTLPTVMSSGLVAEKLLGLIRQKPVRAAAGILMISFGAWTLYHASAHGSHDSQLSIEDHSHHTQH